MSSLIRSFCLAGLFMAVVANTAPGQWNPPERITNNSFDETTFPGSLAIDGNDLIHAAWKQSDSGTGDKKIVYTTRREGIWEPAVEIPSSVPDCTHPDLAVHVNGSAHLVWMQGTGDLGDIFYGTNTSGSWVAERITNNATTDLDPVVAVDGDNIPHAAWAGFDQSSGEGKIFYANRSSGSWAVTVLSGSSIGSFWTGADPRISVSQAGVVQITYRGGDYGTYHIHHATNLSGGWIIQVLTSGNGNDFTSSVRTDYANRCFLAMSGNDGWGMPGSVYSTESADEGASWAAGELASGGYSAAGAVLGTDWKGKMHLAWMETSGNMYTGTIFYSTNRDGSWTSETIATQDENSGPSIVVDGSGGVHVLYVNTKYSGGLVSEVYYLTDSGPGLTLSMLPNGSTVVPRGGALDLDLVVKNETGNAISADFWVTAIPAASGAEALVPSQFLKIPNPAHGTIPAYAVFTGTDILTIPLSAPIGLFTLTGNLGNYTADTYIDRSAVSFRIIP